MTETKHRPLSTATDRDGWVYAVCSGKLCIGVSRTWKGACKVECDWVTILGLHCVGRW